MRPRALLVAVALLLQACQRDLPDLPRQLLPEPPAADVELVIFLAGDGGNATLSRYPILHRLRADVEDWAGRLRSDTAVLVLFLGDNVYPEGLRPPTRAEFAADSAVLHSQAAVLAGENARQRARGYFMAGNHDWGNARGADGVERLALQEEFIQRLAAEGIPIELQPPAGEPGPAVVDVGSSARLLIYDTAWWLLARNDPRKPLVFQQTEEALRGAGQRAVIFASHHPFNSASSHGGNVAFWRTVGVRFLLARSGALLQDLNSVPYREFTNTLLDVFRIRAPLIWAGGHDHSLQVIRNDLPNEPHWSLVSGAASKVSRVGNIEGMQYRHSAPGYMKLFVRRDGRIELFVVAAPSDAHLTCRGQGDELAACVQQTAAVFETTFATRLR